MTLFPLKTLSADLTPVIGRRALEPSAALRGAIVSIPPFGKLTAQLRSHTAGCCCDSREVPSPGTEAKLLRGQDDTDR